MALRESTAVMLSSALALSHFLFKAHHIIKPICFVGTLAASIHDTATALIGLRAAPHDSSRVGSDPRQLYGPTRKFVIMIRT